MDNVIGNRISVALSSNGMTQKTLSAITGINVTSISRYISGERTPNASALVSISNALNTSVDFLLGKEDMDFDYTNTYFLIARNASSMTLDEKRKLIDALFSEG